MNNLLHKYEGELKAAIQATQSQFLNSQQKFVGKHIQQLIQNENRLYRYMQLQIMKLPPLSKQQNMNKLRKYKLKIKEHQEYFKKHDIDQDDQDFAINQIIKVRNQKLEQDRLVMEQNQHMTDNIRNQMLNQRKKLEEGMRANKRIQEQTQQAENTVELIQKAITKRKLMFTSLCGLLILAVIGVIIIKLRRITK